MNSIKKCVTGNSLLFRVLQEKRTTPSVRFLYNEQFLGMDKYVEARERTIARIGNMRGNFYNRMQSQVKSPSSMIFTEDLKTVIHSCEDKPEEMELVSQMITKFHKQNKELRFGTFVFGPVAMRLFYYFQKKDLMVEMFKNPELDGFFDQLKSYLLTMDLLFKNGMYQEVLETFNNLKPKNLAETKFPREAMVLATGACYKINTPETYKLATDLITEARSAKVPIIRKALSFVVALAINQNQHGVALEILSSIDRYNNNTGNNLKLLALAGLDRVQDAFDILRRVTDQDAPVQTRRRRGVICQSTLDTLQKAVERLDDKETSHIFEQLCRSLKESNSITDEEIDNFVCSPIEPRIFREEPFQEGSRSRFPERSFRDSERDAFYRESDFPERRRRFAGIAHDG